jgi:hypothetical protein
VASTQRPTSLPLFSAINVDVKHLKLDEPLSTLYTNDAVYTKYLISTFETRKQAVPAEERIQELLKEGHPRDAE